LTITSHPHQIAGHKSNHFRTTRPALLMLNYKSSDIVSREKETMTVLHNRDNLFALIVRSLIHDKKF
jgi:hypothetical protein